jgi:rubrerythrin
VTGGGVVLVFATLGVTAVVAIALHRVLTRRYGPKVRDGETRCRKCGYILRGITEPRCPECGERI